MFSRHLAQRKRGEGACLFRGPPCRAWTPGDHVCSLCTCDPRHGVPDVFFTVLLVFFFFFKWFALIDHGCFCLI